MFRRVVSHLSFSPALVSDLAFYARRLRREEFTRRLGLIFTVLALIVQSFSIISPPESVNAASSQDLLYGGVANQQEFIARYDKNEANIRDIYTSAGVTRDELLKTREGQFNSKDVRYSAGRNSRFSYAEGERPFTYTKSDGSTGTIYFSLNRSWDTLPYTKANGSTYQALIGHSAKIGWFAIMKNCANLAVQEVPPPPPPPSCPEGQIGTPPQCTTPPKRVAECTSLTITPLSRAKITLQAQAGVANGATIENYRFDITSSTGKSITNQTVNTTREHASYTTTINTPGQYIATVTVATDLGDKTAPACTKSLTIATPDKCPVNAGLLADDTECQPCPGDPSLWVNDSDCASKIILKKSAYNTTKDIEATQKSATASDRITYTISARNNGKEVGTASFAEKLSDVLEYATVIDTGGGSFDTDTKTLTWPDKKLEPGQEQSYSFTVQLASTIPATARGASNPSSYDCIMSNTFGNTIAVPVSCPVPKIIEAGVTELPKTGPTENAIFAGIVLTIVTFFYARARQQKEEIRLIRRDVNTGAL